jgi:hypothetical protein
LLTIRKEQMSIFPTAVGRNLECRILTHLKGVFPRECRRRGEASVRASVRAGIASARAYGLTDDYDVSRYVDLMFIWSDDFSTNPRTAWAEAILTDQALQPGEKLDLLMERTKAAGGPPLAADDGPDRPL